MASGGKRVPRQPAPVSGPGRLSKRTDGGPQSASVASGGAYGERKAAEAQQAAAPMAGSGPAAPPVQGGVGPSPAGLNPGIDVFGPTKRPGQSPMAGVQNVQSNAMARNPQAALRVMYSKFPNPAIQRLLDLSSYGSQPPR
jgi:hypothetical protein